jgi:hypothetical protein
MRAVLWVSALVGCHGMKPRAWSSTADLDKQRTDNAKTRTVSIAHTAAQGPRLNSSLFGSLNSRPRSTEGIVDGLASGQLDPR